MKTELKVKFLQFLLGKKKDQNEGFTLIELLVVVIIIGVLAAIALPNLLGQVGKARESEAKTALGSISRGQQSYHLEKRRFYTSGNAWNDNLGVNPGTKYYNYNKGDKTNADSFADIDAAPKNQKNDGVRSYAAGVAYDVATGEVSGAFTTEICVADALTKTADMTAKGTCANGTIIDAPQAAAGTP